MKEIQQNDDAALSIDEECEVMTMIHLHLVSWRMVKTMSSQDLEVRVWSTSAK